jgi:hypothetical protein
MKAIKAIYTLLTQSAEVTATVYPSRILEGATLPAVVLTQISRVAMIHHQATANLTFHEYK